MSDNNNNKKYSLKKSGYVVPYNNKQFKPPASVAEGGPQVTAYFGEMDDNDSTTSEDQLMANMLSIIADIETQVAETRTGFQAFFARYTEDFKHLLTLLAKKD